MAVLLILICCSACMLSLVLYKKIYNPLTLMTAFWAIIAFFSILGLYNQEIASDKVYFICLIGILGFVAGHLMGGKFRLCFRSNPDQSRTRPREIRILRANIKVINVVLCILIAVLVQRFIRVQMLNHTGISLDLIRVDFNNIVLRSNWERAANTYIIMPLIYLIPVIVIPDFIAYREHVLTLILTAVASVLYAMCDGGRAVFFYCAVFCIICMMMFGERWQIRAAHPDHRSIPKRVKQSLVYGVAVLFIGFAVYMIVYLSKARSITYSLGNSLYSYFTGCFPFFDLHLKTVDFNNQWTYGAAFFHGILNVVFYVLNNLKLLNYPAFFTYTDAVSDVSGFVHIGSANYNTFVTPFFYFYLDFRYFGVVLGSFIYGYMAARFYRNATQTIYNFRNMAAYLLIVQSILTSMVRWQFYNANFTLAVIFILLFPTARELRQRSHSAITELPGVSTVQTRSKAT